MTDRDAVEFVIAGFKSRGRYGPDPLRDMAEHAVKILASRGMLGDIAEARAKALEEAALMTEARAALYTTVGAIALRQAAQAIRRALAKSTMPGDKP
jgi:hypothetical protein